MRNPRRASAMSRGVGEILRKIVLTDLHDPARVGPETRSGVGDAPSQDQSYDGREHEHPQASVDRSMVAGTGRVARADADVERARGDRGDDRRQVGRIVLAVGVELDGDVVPVVDGPAEAGLQRRADAEVVGVREHARARPGDDLARAVARAVVHHHHVHVGPALAQLGERARQARLLVQGRDHDQHPGRAHAGLRFSNTRVSWPAPFTSASRARASHGHGSDSPESFSRS